MIRNLSKRTKTQEPVMIWIVFISSVLRACPSGEGNQQAKGSGRMKIFKSGGHESSHEGERRRLEMKINKTVKKRKETKKVVLSR